MQHSHAKDYSQEVVDYEYRVQTEMKNNKLFNLEDMVTVFLLYFSAFLPLFDDSRRAIETHFLCW